MNSTIPDLQLQYLSWLADAPMFIDDSQVRSFYDAVVRPPGRTTQLRYKIDEEHAKELATKLNLSGEITPGAIVAALASLVPSLKATGEVEGQMTRSSKTTTENEVVIESIDTPQRQLVLLTVHFMLNYHGRWYFVEDLATDSAWRQPASILRSPRSLVFLDFPALAEVQPPMIGTQIVPMAMELEGVGVRTIYNEIKGKSGEGAPQYPPDSPDAEAKGRRQDYWQWFSENFEPRSMMELLEQIAGKDKIRWIDFRVPLNNAGDTVHFHVSPQGKYDTGTFAYNFIKRAYRHGIRIVGTVKSEPDVNVLAVYEK